MTAEAGRFGVSPRPQPPIDARISASSTAVLFTKPLPGRALAAFHPRQGPSATLRCHRFSDLGQVELIMDGRQEVTTGLLDQFVDTPKDLCAGVTYAPFPELQKLPP